MRKIKVKSKRRWEFIDITEQVKKIIESENKNDDGFIHLWCPHTTAGLCVTVRQDEGNPLKEDIGDPDVVRDVKKGLQKLAPYEHGYKHFEMNSDAHIASILTGPQLIIPYQAYYQAYSVPGPSYIKLQLGRWQAIYLAEFDGQRDREVWVNFL
ncbi:MAG: secondary thiamine-phosphate synthase enzyme YjbQ [Petrotogales bacterium]